MRTASGIAALGLMLPVFGTGLVAQRPAGQSSGGLPGRVIEVAATEYAFSAPDTIPAGLTTFLLRQEGRIRTGASLGPAERDSLVVHEGDATAGFHMLWVVRLDSGMTAGEFYATAKADSSAPRAHLLGGPGFAFPPRTTNATMVLEPGQYVLVCYVGSARADRRRYHLLRGMFRPLTVVAAGRNRDVLPAADVTVTLGADSISRFSTPITTAGTWRIGVHNARAKQAEFRMTRVLPGHSVAEALAWRRFDGKPRVSEPWGGVVAVPPGTSMLTTIELVPGTYLASGVVLVVTERSTR